MTKQACMLKVMRGGMGCICMSGYQEVLTGRGDKRVYSVRGSICVGNKTGYVMK